MFNPNVMPSWVSGSAGDGTDGSARKYFRSVAELKKEGAELTEENIKERYLRHGGLLVEKSAPVADASEEEAPAPKRSRAK